MDRRVGGRPAPRVAPTTAATMAARRARLWLVRVHSSVRAVRCGHGLALGNADRAGDHATVHTGNSTNGAKPSSPRGAITPSTIEAQHSHLGSICSRRAVMPVPTIAQVKASMAIGKLVVSRTLIACTDGSVPDVHGVMECQRRGGEADDGQAHHHEAEHRDVRWPLPSAGDGKARRALPKKTRTAAAATAPYTTSWMATSPML